MRRFAMAWLLVLVPALARAQPADKAPEALLSADTAFYFRFDGLSAHRAGYDRTAFAEVLRGDLGTFFSHAAQTLTAQLGKELAKDGPPAGISREQMTLLQTAYARVPALLDHLSQHGVVLGLELVDVAQLKIQLTLIFPGAGKGPGHDALAALLQMPAALGDAKVKESTVKGRKVSTFQGTEPVTIAWWVEGDHLVLVAGTEGAEKAIARADGGANLTANPLFKEIAAFKGYETMVRGYLDLARVLKAGKAAAEAFLPQANDVLAKTGLDGLESLTFYSGFAEKAQRGTVVLRTGKERRGLLKVLNPGPGLEVAKLPPLPADTTSVSAGAVDLGAVMDTFLEVGRDIAKGVAPGADEQIDGALKQVEEKLGFDLRKDLLGSLGTQMVTYNAPGEGFLLFGSGCLWQVKDAKKLQACVDKLLKLATEQSGVPVEIKSRTVNGVELKMITVHQPGMFLVPTYAIHNGWLVAGLTPQVVQGYALRAAGKLPAWKPSEYARKALAENQGKVAALTESDPRPSVQFLLGLAPLAAGAAGSFLPEGLDVSMIPNPAAVTALLFPNVTVTVHEGNAIRFESYESLPIPDVLGDPTMLTFGALSAIGGFARATPVPVPEAAGQVVPAKPAPPPPPPLERKKD